jgi:hypothetical protein
MIPVPSVRCLSATAIKQLVACHPHLFNDGMGCVREPIEDWSRLPVDRDLELKLQA